MSVFENDWIMRQIEGMTDMLGKVLLHREKSEIRIEEELTDEDVKTYYNNIQMLLKEKKYKEAVQYLQENFATGSMEYLKVALTAYDQLNALTEQNCWMAVIHGRSCIMTLNLLPCSMGFIYSAGSIYSECSCNNSCLSRKSVSVLSSNSNRYFIIEAQ